jgi:hypothetical protein
MKSQERDCGGCLEIREAWLEEGELSQVLEEQEDFLR